MKNIISKEKTLQQQIKEENQRIKINRKNNLQSSNSIRFTEISNLKLNDNNIKSSSKLDNTQENLIYHPSNTDGKWFLYFFRRSFMFKNIFKTFKIIFSFGFYFSSLVLIGIFFLNNYHFILKQFFIILKESNSLLIFIFIILIWIIIRKKLRRRLRRIMYW